MEFNLKLQDSDLDILWVRGMGVKIPVSPYYKFLVFSSNHSVISNSIKI